MLKSTLAAAAFSMALFPAFSQQPAFNQNSSRSNHTRSATGGWNFGLTSGPGFAMGSNEKNLFRGNGIGTRLNGDFSFGLIGLGISGGFSTGSISNAGLHTFLTERKIPADQAIINSSKPSSTYLLAGPTFQFGKQIQFKLQLQGGLFLNDPGAVSINQTGVSRTLYRFDGGKTNAFPGFSSAVQLAYPIGKDLRFVVHTDYMYTKSSIRLIDLQQGIDVATEQNRNIGLLNTGVGIIKTFSSREAGSGMATGRRQQVLTPREAGSGQATGRRQQVLTPREAGSGQATGRRVLPTVNKRNIQPVETNAVPASNCGPVTQRIEYPDGRAEQLSFSCPEDAVNYSARINSLNNSMPNRISMNVTTPKQTQGATFGEKVNAGLHAAGSAIQQGASLHIISGTLHWSHAGSSVGIVTNSVSSVGNLAGGAGGGAAAASYARTISNPNNNGLSAEIHTREAGSGMATGRRSREAGSGMATGRRQYQPIYIEGTGTVCDPCNATVKSNPLYVDKGRETVNPLFTKSANGPDDDCDGVAGITVLLVDATAGTVVASTKTESCGDFWFANVPDGNYVVQLQGSLVLQQQYNVNITAKETIDMAGAFTMGNDQWVLELHQQAMEGNKRVINTSRSNIKGRTEIKADTDGDGKTDLIWSPRSNINDPATKNTGGIYNILPVSLQAMEGEDNKAVVAGGKISDLGMSRKGTGLGQGAALLGGALPGGAIISAAVSSVSLAPGNPIGGIVVKGGKSGQRLFNSNTNEYGEFEWTGLNAGEYTITAEWPLVIDHQAFVSLGNANATASRKGWDGTVKGGNVVAESSDRINRPDADPDMNATPETTNRAQNNNTVRSNRGGFRAHIDADLDGDGSMETSFNNFNDQLLIWSVNGNGSVQTKVVEKATSGLKDCLKTQVRMAGSNNDTPIKWTAPELASKVGWSGDPHENLDHGILYLEDEVTVLAGKGHWRSTELGIRKIGLKDGQCFVISAKPGDYPSNATRSIQQITGSPMKNATLVFASENCMITRFTTNEQGVIHLNGLPPGTDHTMYVNAMVAGDEDILVVCNGNTVRVLKTKHDTAKNSVSNIR